MLLLSLVVLPELYYIYYIYYTIDDSPANDHITTSQEERVCLPVRDNILPISLVEGKGFE